MCQLATHCATIKNNTIRNGNRIANTKAPAADKRKRCGGSSTKSSTDSSSRMLKRPGGFTIASSSFSPDSVAARLWADERQSGASRSSTPSLQTVRSQSLITTNALAAAAATAVMVCIRQLYHPKCSRCLLRNPRSTDAISCSSIISLLKAHAKESRRDVIEPET